MIDPVASRAWRNPLLLAMLLLTAVGAYWPSLHGGFVFDDFPNIVDNRDVHITSLDWESLRQAALASPVKILKRPLAMASFGLDHYFSGGPVVPGGRKDLSWIAPHGGEMTDADWYDGNLRTIGMFLAGDALRATDAEGNALTDSSFLLALNATPETRQVVVPDPSWAPAYEVVLDTSNSMVTEVEAGATVPLAPRCLVLLRAL